MPYQIHNWREHQGYQKRGPKWVKLHANLLRNKFWPRLSILARATLPALWIVASEQSQDGTFDDDLRSLSHLVSMPIEELSAAISELKSFGFIDSDKYVAVHATRPSHQTERETEAEREKNVFGAHAREAFGTETDPDETDRLDDDIALEEKRFNTLALAIGRERIQSVLDSLPRPKNVGAFSASRWLATGRSGIGRSEQAMIRLRLTCDGLEQWQRQQAQPYISDKTKATFDTIDRVLGTGAYAGLAALPGGKR